MNEGQNQALAHWQQGDLQDVVLVMARVHGVDVSSYEVPFLIKSLDNRRQATAAETTGAYIEHLHDRVEADALCRLLRVTYSEFFRNSLAFALLEQLVLPDLVEKSVRNHGGELRIWSAGCAAGQEAWSVAILLDEMADTLAHCVPFRIFATDLSEANLTFARNGIYSESAMGNVRLRHLQRYFARQGDSFAIVPRIKSRVDFSTYDLLDKSTSCPPASIYGHFDLVLCSNVLLYYRRDAKGFILDKLGSCLVAGRYLMTGETERHIVEEMGGFRPVAPPASVYQRV
jgi:chemotaxis protein methyltransferase CheR